MGIDIGYPGYVSLIMVRSPKFLDKLLEDKDVDEHTKEIIRNFKHELEFANTKESQMPI